MFTTSKARDGSQRFVEEPIGFSTKNLEAIRQSG